MWVSCPLFLLLSLSFLILEGGGQGCLDCARRTRAFRGRAFREQEGTWPLPLRTLTPFSTPRTISSLVANPLAF